MALKWCDETDSILKKFTSDLNRDVDFIIFTLEGKKEMKIQEGHYGKGGRAKVEEILSEGYDDKVMIGAFLALAVDERGSVVSTRRKYIHFQWVGPSVGVMVKGRVNSMSGGFRDKFPGCAIYLQLMGDLDQLEEKNLEKSLLACGGAHKPSRYDFTNVALESTPAQSVKPTETKVSEPKAEVEASDSAQEEEEPSVLAPEAEQPEEKAPAPAPAPEVAAATDSDSEGEGEEESESVAEPAEEETAGEAVPVSA